MYVIATLKNNKWQLKSMRKFSTIKEAETQRFYDSENDLIIRFPELMELLLHKPIDWRRIINENT